LAAQRRFTWDDPKSERCYKERGFDFAHAARLFEGVVVERIDARQNYGEIRVQAIGHIDGLLYVVVYTLRFGAIHIISARRAHQKEWERWQRLG
jgi:uncharacterized DUF497 family protein